MSKSNYDRTYLVDSSAVSREEFIERLVPYFLWSKERAVKEVAHAEEMSRIECLQSGIGTTFIGESYHGFSTNISVKEERDPLYGDSVDIWYGGKSHTSRHVSPQSAGSEPDDDDADGIYQDDLID